MNRSTAKAVASVLGTEVDALDMESAVSRTRELLTANGSNYVCVAGVHGVVEAQRSAELANAYRGAALTLPDGMPLVWVGHLQGHKTMRRVTGPDFMLEIFRRQEFRNLRHFLYGGDAGVAQQLNFALKQRFPNASIVGAETPPFRDLFPDEEASLVARIRALCPDVIWIGLGCPRQELFMQRYAKLLDARILVGVGAAFDYHTGRIRDSPEWVKKAGLQWLHRLIQNPRRLWKRYLRNNPAFVWRISLQLLAERISPPSSTAPAVHATNKLKQSLNTSASAETSLLSRQYDDKYQTPA
jgi:N-acetylglucosaminyldiphosphoundecaprenol N-acetyl-beta-D-mannosaminyltransferase